MCGMDKIETTVTKMILWSKRAQSINGAAKYFPSVPRISYTRCPVIIGPALNRAPRVYSHSLVFLSDLHISVPLKVKIHHNSSDIIPNTLD